MNSPDIKKWEEGFVRFGLDSAVGRLFRGIIHNLNGVGQAFSMQAELLPMMFKQADDLLGAIAVAPTLEEAQAKGAELRLLLARRAGLTGHLGREVEILQETMHRMTSLAAEIGGPNGTNRFKLDSVIMTEMEFLNSDSFFKHKIAKELTLTAEMPDLDGYLVEIHQIVGVLLENAAQAFATDSGKDAAPKISITTGTVGGNIEVRVTDNGSGVPPDDCEKIFEPFFTTRENHLGLGLYLARVMAGRAGGTLTCDSSPGRTSFVLLIPGKGGPA